MEDRSLEEQLQHITWGATMKHGHATMPTGFLTPIEEEANAATKPRRSVGGPRPHSPFTKVSRA